MPFVLVAPGICRFTVHGQFSGREVANILDMKIDTTGSPVSRGQVIGETASRILNAWSNHILQYLQMNNYTATSVSWLDLDAEDGETGEISSTDDFDWPKAGAGLTDAMPGNVAMRVNKRTNSRRGQKQGRMYICGVAENSTDDASPNMLTSATISGGNPRLASFLTDITQETNGNPLESTTQLHVVHLRGQEYVGSTEVTGLELDPTLGSQRRRLR